MAKHKFVTPRLPLQKAALREVLEDLRTKEREADRLAEKIEMHEHKASMQMASALHARRSVRNKGHVHQKEEGRHASSQWARSLLPMNVCALSRKQRGCVPEAWQSVKCPELQECSFFGGGLLET